MYQIIQIFLSMSQDIYLVCGDEQTGEIFILPGQTIEMIINREEIWE